MTTSGTVTIMFTDLVGSSELIAGLGEDRANAIRREHFDTLRAVIAAFEGTEIKSLGDGLMVAFNSTVKAVGCAAAAQRCVDHANQTADVPLGLRVGVSVGEATFEAGDWFGSPVVEAARLCGVAQGGQILVADLVRMLAGDRGGHHFDSIRALSLKGFPEPVVACDVDWRAEERHLWPLPPALSASGGTIFVGRDHERARLQEAWERTVAGQRMAVLIAGEPGIGKTRLVAEFAASNL
jgi:class 3 adenylate cyclase